MKSWCSPPWRRGVKREFFTPFPVFFKGVPLYVYMYCCQAPKTGTDSICKCNTASYSFRYVSQSTHAQEHILPVSYWTEQIWYVIFLREAWSYKNGLIFWDSPNGLWKYVAVLRREWRRCLYMKNYQTSPQAKCHQPLLIFISLAISTAFDFITKLILSFIKWKH